MPRRKATRGGKKYNGGSKRGSQKKKSADTQQVKAARRGKKKSADTQHVKAARRGNKQLASLSSGIHVERYNRRCVLPAAKEQSAGSQDTLGIMETLDNTKKNQETSPYVIPLVQLEQTQNQKDVQKMHQLFEELEQDKVEKDARDEIVESILEHLDQLAQHDDNQFVVMGKIRAEWKNEFFMSYLQENREKCRVDYVHFFKLFHNVELGLKAKYPEEDVAAFLDNQRVEEHKHQVVELLKQDKFKKGGSICKDEEFVVLFKALDDLAKGGMSHVANMFQEQWDDYKWPLQYHLRRDDKEKLKSKFGFLEGAYHQYTKGKDHIGNGIEESLKEIHTIIQADRVNSDGLSMASEDVLQKLLVMYERYASLHSSPVVISIQKQIKSRFWPHYYFGHRGEFAKKYPHLESCFLELPADMIEFCQHRFDEMFRKMDDALLSDLVDGSDEEKESILKLCEHNTMYCPGRVKCAVKANVHFRNFLMKNLRGVVNWREKYTHLNGLMLQLAMEQRSDESDLLGELEVMEQEVGSAKDDGDVEMEDTNEHDRGGEENRDENDDGLHEREEKEETLMEEEKNDDYDDNDDGDDDLVLMGMTNRPKDREKNVEKAALAVDMEKKDDDFIHTPKEFLVHVSKPGAESKQCTEELQNRNTYDEMFIHGVFRFINKETGVAGASIPERIAKYKFQQCDPFFYNALTRLRHRCIWQQASRNYIAHDNFDSSNIVQVANELRLGVDPVYGWKFIQPVKGKLIKHLPAQLGVNAQKSPMGAVRYIYFEVVETHAVSGVECNLMLGDCGDEPANLFMEADTKVENRDNCQTVVLEFTLQYKPVDQVKEWFGGTHALDYVTQDRYVREHDGEDCLPCWIQTELSKRIFAFYLRFVGRCEKIVDGKSIPALEVLSGRVDPMHAKDISSQYPNDPFPFHIQSHFMVASKKTSEKAVAFDFAKLFNSLGVEVSTSDAGSVSAYINNVASPLICCVTPDKLALKVVNAPCCVAVPVYINDPEDARRLKKDGIKKQPGWLLPNGVTITANGLQTPDQSGYIADSLEIENQYRSHVFPSPRLYPQVQLLHTEIPRDFVEKIRRRFAGNIGAFILANTVCCLALTKVMTPERPNEVMVMVGPPHVGKSTLCTRIIYKWFGIQAASYVFSHASVSGALNQFEGQTVCLVFDDLAEARGTAGVGNRMLDHGRQFYDGNIGQLTRKDGVRKIHGGIISTSNQDPVLNDMFKKDPMGASRLCAQLARRCICYFGARSTGPQSEEEFKELMQMFDHVLPCMIAELMRWHPSQKPELLEEAEIYLQQSSEYEVVRRYCISQDAEFIRASFDWKWRYSYFILLGLMLGFEKKECQAIWLRQLLSSEKTNLSVFRWFQEKENRNRKGNRGVPRHVVSAGSPQLELSSLYHRRKGVVENEKKELLEDGVERKQKQVQDVEMIDLSAIPDGVDNDKESSIGSPIANDVEEKIDVLQKLSDYCVHEIWEKIDLFLRKPSDWDQQKHAIQIYHRGPKGSSKENHLVIGSTYPLHNCFSPLLRKSWYPQISHYYSVSPKTKKRKKQQGIQMTFWTPKGDKRIQSYAIPMSAFSQEQQDQMYRGFEKFRSSIDGDKEKETRMKLTRERDVSLLIPPDRNYGAPKRVVRDAGESNKSIKEPVTLPKPKSKRKLASKQSKSDFDSFMESADLNYDDEDDVSDNEAGKQKKKQKRLTLGSEDEEEENDDENLPDGELAAGFEEMRSSLVGPGPKRILRGMQKESEREESESDQNVGDKGRMSSIGASPDQSHVNASPQRPSSNKHLKELQQRIIEQKNDIIRLISESTQDNINGKTPYYAMENLFKLDMLGAKSMVKDHLYIFERCKDKFTFPNLCGEVATLMQCGNQVGSEEDNEEMKNTESRSPPKKKRRMNESGRSQTMIDGQPLLGWNEDQLPSGAGRVAGQKRKKTLLNNEEKNEKESEGMPMDMDNSQTEAVGTWVNDEAREWFEEFNIMPEHVLQCDQFGYVVLDQDGSIFFVARMAEGTKKLWFAMRLFGVDHPMVAMYQQYEIAYDGMKEQGYYRCGELRIGDDHELPQLLKDYSTLLVTFQPKCPLNQCTLSESLKQHLSSINQLHVDASLDGHALGVAYVTQCVKGPLGVQQATGSSDCFIATPSCSSRKFNRYYPFDGYWKFPKAIAISDKSIAANPSYCYPPKLLEAKSIILSWLRCRDFNFSRWLEKIGEKS